MKISADFKEELGRKIIHLTSIIIVIVYWYFGKDAAISFLISYLSIILIFEYLRIDRGIRLPYVHSHLREKEKGYYSGNLFLAIGSFIAISAFSKEIALAAILLTTFCDSTAAIVGKSIGKHKANNSSKTIEGSISAFFVGLIVTYFLIGNPVVMIVMSSVATITEFGVIKTDDNLMIPVLSGFSGHLTLLVIGYLSQLAL